MKLGSELTGLELSSVERGSSLRWPLRPENSTRNESPFAAIIGSIFRALECFWGSKHSASGSDSEGGLIFRGFWVPSLSPLHSAFG
ncbi:hypothetical protein L3X38_030679 [Prunus dulcis]|uniref:Uncharacterized protein n=1 Tax=Prunus dulcis TaxID=3755 RepID=A0AAD4YUX2_PRUDU|nr:hypothetical protein L3X38_030679 [Prunus dulcis]